VDHLTISTGDGGYFSFAEHGIIQKIYRSLRMPKSSAGSNENMILPTNSVTLHRFFRTASPQFLIRFRSPLHQEAHYFCARTKGGDSFEKEIP
jgi:hypothetical protein